MCTTRTSLKQYYSVPFTFQTQKSDTAIIFRINYQSVCRCVKIYCETWKIGDQIARNSVPVRRFNRFTGRV
jgi:hypothetical protein